MITDGFIDGREAVRYMISEINHLDWTSDETDLSILNEMYSGARDAAIAFGMDIHEFPRRLRFRTRRNL